MTKEEWQEMVNFVTKDTCIKEEYKSNIMDRNKEHFVVITPLTCVISNVWFWTDNEKEIMQYLEEQTVNGVDTHQGMTLTFDNESECLWFNLRWG